VDEELVADAVTDTILALITHPSSYDPQRGNLSSYLWMSARGDLNNALERRNRQRDREIPTDPVELLADKRNFGMEAPASESGMETEIGQALASATDPLDRRMLVLMLHGERRTEAYAEVIGVADRTPPEQRRIIKRHKDRIKKRLRRLLSRHREHERP
jgi:RNA polymerase sigma-70 factor (ECF subfamily)